MIRLFILLLLLLSNASFASNKIKVAASTAPIASMVKMIGGKYVEITTLSGSFGCAHNHSMKPSQLVALRSANLVIYINEEFEHFMEHLFDHLSHDSKIIRLGDSKLTLLKNKGHINWHIWFDFNNDKIILNKITEELIALQPKHASYFQKQFELHTNLLEKAYKNAKSRAAALNNSKFVSLSESAEYLVKSLQLNSISFDMNDHIGIKQLAALEQVVKQNNIDYIIIDNEQHLSLFKDKTIQLNSEDWSNLAVDQEHLLASKITELVDALVGVR